jgi:diguanylate cyclase (GGDEF)-like protein/PAS domain S-box-containing protein
MRLLPAYEDPEQTRAATLLALLVFATFLISAVFTLAFNLRTPGQPVNWMTVGFFWFGLALTGWLMFKRQLSTASLVFHIFAILTVTERVGVAYGGIASPMISILFLLVISSGVLLGRAWGYRFGLLVALCLSWVHFLSPLATTADPTTHQRFFFQLFMLFLAVQLQASIVRALLAARDQADRQRDERQATYQELLDLQHTLEQHIAERTHQVERQKLYYQALVDDNPQAIITLDEAHKIVDCNPAFERLFGYQKAEIIGQPLDPLVASPAIDDGNVYQAAAANTRLVLAGEHIQGSGVRYRKDGAPVEVEFIGVPVKLNGKQVGAQAIYIDITEKQRAEKARRAVELRYRQAVNNSPNPIFTIDNQGLIQIWNPACAQIFQYGFEMVGQPYHLLIQDPDTRVHLDSYLERVQSGASLANIDLTYTCRDGSQRQMVSRIFPLIGDDGQVSGCVFANTDVTERQKMAEELQFSELKFRSIVEQSQDGIAIFDETGHITDWNPKLEEISGLSASQVLGKTILEVVRRISPSKEDLRALYQAATSATLDTGALFDEQLRAGNSESVSFGYQVLEHTISLPDGSTRILQSVLFPTQTHGRTIGAVFSRDITERVQAEEHLASFYRSIAAVLDGIEVGVYVADLTDGRFMMVNRNLEETLGPGLLDQHCYEAFYCNPQPCENCTRHQLLDQDGQPTGGRVWEALHPRTRRWYSCSEHAIRWHTAHAEASEFVRLGVIIDITDRKEAEARLEYLATHDALTGLPNRALFEDRLKHALALARRQRQSLAVLFMDLDGFKKVNDQYGHQIGDQALVTMADRLQKCLRETDSLARVGGDEFTFVLENLGEYQNAAIAAEKILAAVSAPYSLGEIHFDLSASIGISIFPDDSDEADVLINAADVAMYAAKEEGKNAFRYFNHAIYRTMNLPGQVSRSSPLNSLNT